jgi:hypothetical protein
VAVRYLADETLRAEIAVNAARTHVAAVTKLGAAVQHDTDTANGKVLDVPVVERVSLPMQSTTPVRSATSYVDLDQQGNPILPKDDGTRIGASGQGIVIGSTPMLGTKGNGKVVA